jgi:hypothetical protein
VIPTPVKGWWEPGPEERTHEVTLLCRCPDIEACVTERYASDVRLAIRDLQVARAALDAAGVGVGA